MLQTIFWFSLYFKVPLFANLPLSYCWSLHYKYLWVHLAGDICRYLQRARGVLGAVNCHNTGCVLSHCCATQVLSVYSWPVAHLLLDSTCSHPWKSFAESRQEWQKPNFVSAKGGLLSSPWRWWICFQSPRPALGHSQRKLHYPKSVCETQASLLSLRLPPHHWAGLAVEHRGAQGALNGLANTSSVLPSEPWM